MKSGIEEFARAKATRGPPLLEVAWFMERLAPGLAPHPGRAVLMDAANSMWTLDNVTAGNGATRIVPGSHLFPGRVREEVSAAWRLVRGRSS
ncbi:MAG: hypothetical protein OXG13_06495 [Gemmatimonadaceae bacterium]|nr:hypothetical protein [Gemmatimonadaceae bacterium]